MKAQEMVAKVKDLPPISDSALQLVALLDRSEGSNEDVVQVLRQDAVLTAKLLRACNSSAAALEEPVGSVDQAVLILGYTQILQMVMALAFGGTMSVRLPGYDIEAKGLWRHSLLAASAAEVAVQGGIEVEAEASVAFTVGLLHDIGKVVTNQFLSREFQAAVRQHITEGLASAEAEREVLGTDHAEVGACLLRQWRLPEDIIEAVANHHAPRLEPYPRLSAVAHLADCLAHLVGGAPGWEAYALRSSEPVLATLRIDAPKIEHLLISVSETFGRTDKLMALA